MSKGSLVFLRSSNKELRWERQHERPRVNSWGFFPLKFYYMWHGKQSILKKISQTNSIEGNLILFFFFFLPLLWSLQHMEVPGLRVELEPQLPAYTTATAMPDLSCMCNLHHSLQQCWTRPGIEITSSRTLCWVLTLQSHKGTPIFLFLMLHIHQKPILRHNLLRHTYGQTAKCTWFYQAYNAICVE